MLVKSIKLRNFRCHKQYELACTEQTTLILGKNGSGKTSVLEAIYEALRGKSFRATDAEIMRRGADFYQVELTQDDGEVRSVTFDGQKKNFRVQGRKYQRLPARYQYPIVLFEFKDLDLVSASPSRKRSYFDEAIGRITPSYAQNLRHYEQTIRQRNQLIKQEASPEQFFSWDILLAKYGCALRRERQHYLDMVNQQLSAVYQSIAHNQDQITVVYRPYGAEEAVVDIQEYLSALQRHAQRDLLFGYTTYGAHRDQYDFIFNGQPAKGSASRGEVRSIMISLKFIEAAEIEAKTHVKPLILLDDVFSELDAERRQCLVENFRDHQIILTSTESY